MAERAERWAAESAQSGPGARSGHLVGEVLPRLIVGVVVLALVGVVAFVSWEVTHRSKPGGHQGSGWVTAGTCFADDPNGYLEGVEFRMEIPTVDCDDPHRAEAFLSFELLPTDLDDPMDECAREWAGQSEVAPRVSTIQLTYLTQTRQRTIEETAVCVAVGPEPVEGRSLATWRP